LTESGTFLLRCDVPSTNDIRAFSRDDTNAGQGVLCLSTSQLFRGEHGNDDGIDRDVLQLYTPPRYDLRRRVKVSADIVESIYDRARREGDDLEGKKEQ
jgi:hypothetical protein